MSTDIRSPLDRGRSPFSYLLLPLSDQLFRGIVVLAIDDPGFEVSDPNALSNTNLVAQFADLLGLLLRTSLSIHIQLASRFLSDSKKEQIQRSMAQDTSLSAFAHDSKTLSHTVEALADEMYFDIGDGADDKKMREHCHTLRGIYRETLDLVDLIRNPVGTCNLAKSSRGIRLHLQKSCADSSCKHSISGCFAKVSPPQVKRMLRELGENALRHSDPQIHSVHCGNSVDARDGTYCGSVIIDFSQTISEGILSRIRYA